MDRELLIGLIGMAVIGSVAYSVGLKDGANLAVRRTQATDGQNKK